MTLSGAATLALYGADAGDIDGSGVGSFANAISVPADASGTFLAPFRYSLTSLLSGDGTFNLRVNGVRGDVSGNWSAFNGQVNVTSRSGVGDFRVAATVGLPAAGLYLATNVLMYSRTTGGAVIPIGELTASPGAVVSAGFGSSPGTQNDVTWRVGGLNTDATNAAVFQGTTKLIKQGTGRWTLSGTSTHTGATTISNGTLAVTGAFVASPVTVASNAVLTGSGFLGGGLTVLPAGILAPEGTLTLSNQLALTTATVRLDLSSSPAGTNDKLALRGGLLALTNTQSFNFHLTDGFLGAGTYALITGATNTTSSALAFTHNLPAGARQGLAFATPPGQVLLNVTGNVASLTWHGTNGSAWDTTTTNWLNAASADKFWPFDAVTFDDSSSNGTVSLAGLIQPRSLIVSNTTRAYTFAGGGTLEGTTALVKTGSGALTLAPARLALSSVTSSNSPTVTMASTGGLAAGLVVEGTGIPAGAKVAGVVDHATLTLSTNTTATATNTLTYFAANSFSGGTFLEGGTLVLANDAANSHGLGTGPITFAGGTLTMYDNSGSYNASIWDLVVPAGKTGKLNHDSRCDLYGTLTGGGTLNLTVSYVRGTLYTDGAAFTGQLNVSPRSGGAEFRLANPNGLPASALYLANDITAYPTADNATVVIGELAGSAGATLAPGNGGGVNPTWVVGGKNTLASFAGTIRDAGVTKVVKAGSGEWTLTGSNSFSGGLAVSGGTLLVNNVVGSGTGSGSVDVQAGATLGGNGIIAGAVTIETDATLSPGMSIGRLTVSNSLTLSADSTTFIELHKSLGTNDSVVCGGAVSFDGELVVTNLGGALAPGDAFQIFQAASASGNFADIVGTPGPEMAWSFNPASGVLSVVTTPPPPSSAFYTTITFPGYNRAEVLTNFRCLVLLSTNLPGFSYAQFQSPNAGDLRFSTEDGSGALNYEIDTWNPAGESRVWVQVPALGSNTAISASWGNSVLTNLPASTTNGATWSQGYLDVWHLRETNGAHLDSSPALASARFTQVAGQGTAAGIVGAGDNFISASRNYVSLPDMGTNSAVTVEAWLNLAGTPAGADIGVVSSDSWGVGYTHFKVSNALQLKAAIGGAGDVISSNNLLAMGTWFHVAYTIGGTATNDLKLYCNAGLVGTASGRADNNLTDVNIAREYGGRYLNARVDQVRISKVARSSNWLWATYQNIRSNALFSSASPVSALVLPAFESIQFTNGHPSLTIAGAVGYAYTVQGSTNLLSWTDLLVTNPAALPFFWTDPRTVNWSRCFYRVWLSP